MTTNPPDQKETEPKAAGGKVILIPSSDPALLFTSEADTLWSELQCVSIEAAQSPVPFLAGFAERCLYFAELLWMPDPPSQERKQPGSQDSLGENSGLGYGTLFQRLKSEEEARKMNPRDPWRPLMADPQISAPLTYPWASNATAAGSTEPSNGYYESWDRGTFSFVNSQIDPSNLHSAGHEPQAPFVDPRGTIQYDAGVDALDEISVNTLVGYVYMTAQPPDNVPAGEVNVGIIILPHFRGQGMAKQGLETLLKWAFEELGVHRVQALILNPNKRENVRRLFTRMGFTHEGTHRRAAIDPSDNAYKDVAHLAMLDTDWVMRDVNPAPALWDELFERHSRESDALMRWEELRGSKGLKRSASTETIKEASPGKKAKGKEKETATAAEQEEWRAKEDEEDKALWQNTSQFDDAFYADGLYVSEDKEGPEGGASTQAPSLPVESQPVPSEPASPPTGLFPKISMKALARPSALARSRPLWDDDDESFESGSDDEDRPGNSPIQRARMSELLDLLVGQQGATSPPPSDSEMSESDEHSSVYSDAASEGSVYSLPSVPGSIPLRRSVDLVMDADEHSPSRSASPGGTQWDMFETSSQSSASLESASESDSDLA